MAANSNGRSYYRGDFSSLKSMAKAIKDMPSFLSKEIAQRGAVVLGSMVAVNWDSGTTAWGASRPVSKVDGRPLSLFKTGSARNSLTYTSSGSRIKVSLGTDHAKYLIGKYKVMPNVGLPMTWGVILQTIRRQVVDEYMARVRSAA